MAPDGSLAGKYRKVVLPAEEVEQGIMPGDDYPVFTTRFGKVAMMICYDAFFPEVARQLANRGAEVIAVPIYGGNLSLASARALDNHVYLVTSTYMDPADEWMRTGIFDHTGRLIATTGTQGTVAVAEVDLGRPADWRWLGHFKSRIPHERPVWSSDAAWR
jgi:predicted amidohydrolase